MSKAAHGGRSSKAAEVAALLQLKRAAARFAMESHTGSVSWDAQFGYYGIQLSALRYGNLLSPAARKRLAGKP